jgi:type VI secretion system secreted protein Hcp
VPLDAQLMLVGERQGLITKTGAGKLSAPEVRVFHVSHKIVSPRSPHSGLSTGKRHHKPLLIRKEVNASSIGIARALSDNENLTEVRLRFYAPGPIGPRQHFTLQLFNATLCSVRTFLPYTRAAPRTAATAGHDGGRAPMPPGKRGAPYLTMWEEVTFTYLTIQWSWNETHWVAQDNWLSAR